jgi:halocyanin-like protein
MDERTSEEPTRRGLLRGVAGATVAGAGVAASSTTAAAQSFGGWFDDVPNYDGVVDRTGQDEVTVEVGIDTANGPYGFGPAAVRVDPGTTVTFSWVSNTHNVVIESQPEGSDWGGVTDIYDEGHSATHTFETEGVYEYYCDPHRVNGMKGAVVVGDVELDHSSGLVLTDSLLAIGGALALGVLSPIVFALFLRSRYREDDVAESE